MLVMKYKDKTVKALKIVKFEYISEDNWINYSTREYENEIKIVEECLELLDSVYVDGVLVYECQKGLN